MLEVNSGKRVLVVGATGQLGAEVVRQASAAGYRVRALVRHSSDYAPLTTQGAELAFGDLRDIASLETACQGVDVVIATATVVFPSKGLAYSFEADEGRGYENLVQACRSAAVGRVIFVSIAMPFTSSYLALVPTLRMKAACERLLEGSDLSYTIFKCAPFMDDYFALIGSALPLEGERSATLNRSTGATRFLRRLTGRTIETVGLASIPGPKSARHAFITVHDVAQYLVAAVDNPKAHRATFVVGGPESLSWEKVCRIYGELLGRRVRILSSPPGVYKVLARLTRRFSEATSNQMSLLWVLGENESAFDSRAVAAGFGVTLTSASAYLTEKARALESRSGGKFGKRRDVD